MIIQIYIVCPEYLIYEYMILINAFIMFFLVHNNCIPLTLKCHTQKCVNRENNYQVKIGLNVKSTLKGKNFLEQIFLKFSHSQSSGRQNFQLLAGAIFSV